MQRNNESGLRSYYTANGMFGSPPSSPHEASNNPPPPVLFSHSLGGGAAPPSAAVAAPLAEPVKRKRGRPRKYGAGTASPSSASVMKPLASPRQPPVQSPTGSSASSKRKEASKKAQMSGLESGEDMIVWDEWNLSRFMKDVALNIMSFMQQRKRAVCIITACGSISNACIRQQAMLSGNTTYEGHYEILSLSGSYLPSETAGAFSRTGGLSICLSGADGDIVGGGVGGPIVAAGPVQVIAGSFVIDSDKDSNAGSVAEPKLSAPSIARPSVFSPPHFRSTVDSTARFFSNRSDDHLAGGATNFMLQSCATNATCASSGVNGGPWLSPPASSSGVNSTRPSGGGIGWKFSGSCWVLMRRK
ncbi:hypothetical protein QJS04_geneDACA014855 [Acorus gramineus]|uniref:AT-hook motif nuclear-localized protein n=1 Tax=Acorus gramineus TaxID=55184 RepID=A0AAV9A2Z8_ACOGR|nr:hypothetical protein QJS04_geneDACA023866 [Acorus gramineus]KAK1258530.1 hypothetical protein QJS04_geneDACA014855 [Acorus gramineus]